MNQVKGLYTIHIPTNWWSIKAWRIISRYRRRWLTRLFNELISRVMSRSMGKMEDNLDKSNHLIEFNREDYRWTR